MMLKYKIKRGRGRNEVNFVEVVKVMEIGEQFILLNDFLYYILLYLR